MGFIDKLKQLATTAIHDAGHAAAAIGKPVAQDVVHGATVVVHPAIAAAQAAVNHIHPPAPVVAPRPVLKPIAVPPRPNFYFQATGKPGVNGAENFNFVGGAPPVKMPEAQLNRMGHYLPQFVDKPDGSYLRMPNNPTDKNTTFKDIKLNTPAPGYKGDYQINPGPSQPNWGFQQPVDASPAYLKPKKQRKAPVISA